MDTVGNPIVCDDGVMRDEAVRVFAVVGECNVVEDLLSVPGRWVMSSTNDKHLGVKPYGLASSNLEGSENGTIGYATVSASAIGGTVDM